MLTSYMVSCPYPGCHWMGSLLPRGNREAYRTALPTTPEVVFRCPSCAREWHARVIGDDVENVHFDQVPAATA